MLDIMRLRMEWDLLLAMENIFGTLGGSASCLCNSSNGKLYP